MCIFLREFLPNVGLTSLGPVSMLIFLCQESLRIQKLSTKLVITVSCSPKHVQTQVCTFQDINVIITRCRFNKCGVWCLELEHWSLCVGLGQKNIFTPNRKKYLKKFQIVFLLFFTADVSHFLITNIYKKTFSQKFVIEK